MARAHNPSKDIIVKVAVECTLTDAERLQAAKVMADAINRRNRIIESLETFKMQKKAEIQAADAEIAAGTVLVNSGREFRLIECRVEYNFGAGVKCFKRLDNDEVVRREDITNEERQTMMPGLPPAVDGKSKAAGE